MAIFSKKILTKNKKVDLHQPLFTAYFLKKEILQVGCP